VGNGWRACLILLWRELRQNRFDHFLDHR